MSNDPTVSVVMSVYNGEKHLAEAVQTVLDQSYTDFEFIIVNDGSTDRTREILNSFTDPRLCIIEQANLGLATGLNTGINQAKGRYIARQDADDIWRPTKLARQVPIIEVDPVLDVVACLSEVIDEEGEGPLLHITASLDPRVETPFPHPSVLIRLSALLAVDGYDARLRYGQDRDLWLRLFNGHNFYVVPEVLVVWRQTRDKDLIKSLIYTEYGALVASLAGVPLYQREPIIADAMKRIASRRSEIEEQIQSGKINTQKWLDDQYHLMWAGKYLRAGQANRARLHFKQLIFCNLSSFNKLKYLLAFMPGRMASWLMKFRLRLNGLLVGLRGMR